MPDDSGRLSAGEQARIAAWIDDKWTAESSRCPVCHHDGWILGDFVVVPPRFGSGRVQLTGPLAPQVMLVCGRCGHTLYFNAAMIGIVADAAAADGVVATAAAIEADPDSDTDPAGPPWSPHSP